MTTMTLQQLNAASTEAFVSLLEGVYEHSPWIAAGAAERRPFASLVHLKYALASVVREAPRGLQLALLRAHPELAGKAMVTGTLTAESTDEQQRAGLTHCTPEDYARLLQLNADYNARFGWPFILAVRGPRGDGLNRQQIIAAFAARLNGHADVELAECLRQVHRIAEIRLNDKFGVKPTLGNQLLAWSDELAVHSDPGFKEQGQLCTLYLTEAHRACAAQLRDWMQKECGFDEVRIDAVGNVVGLYRGSAPDAKILLTGSHYDTVRNAGKYDGRLGIFIPMLAVRELVKTGKRLQHGIELIAFAEEECQRYKGDFLGSSAVIGHFDAAWLDQVDADGVSMGAAMLEAGLPAEMDAIKAETRDPANYLGFIEVHIEQGPVLTNADLPLGIVTSINGSVRYTGELRGLASHAGTTPMGARRDAAAAVAELILFVEQRAAAVPDVVGTVGMLEVPAGSINVIPGRCRFSLDLRATTDEARDALEHDVLSELSAICERRGVSFTLTPMLKASAAPSDASWQQRWESAVSPLGLPLLRLPSGAGHDAMKIHELMPQAMLFVRGQNLGISHNPLEAVNNDDAELALRAFQNLIEKL